VKIRFHNISHFISFGKRRDRSLRVEQDQGLELEEGIHHLGAKLRLELKILGVRGKGVSFWS
jgi:hypothetical protein